MVGLLLTFLKRCSRFKEVEFVEEETYIEKLRPIDSSLSSVVKPEF